MLVTAALTSLLLVGWMMAAGLAQTSMDTRLFREANIIAAADLREFQSGGMPQTRGGTFTNGFSYRVVINSEQSSFAGLARLNCSVLWETTAPLATNAATATNTLSLVAVRLSP